MARKKEKKKEIKKNQKKILSQLVLETIYLLD